jgi:hypothetical protein
LHPSCLRQNERAFKVTLKGERVEGEVGPYQETMSQLCSELQPDEVADEEAMRLASESSGSSSSTSSLGGSTSQSSLSSSSSSSSSSSRGESADGDENDEEVLPLFIPCPNRQLARQLIGIGENRDKFIPKPSATSVNELRMFEFVGRLMGIAIRTKSILSLNLPSIFWKPLVGIAPSLADLKAIDFSTVSSLEKILEMDRDVFEASVFETYTTLLSDKTVVELVPGGKEKTVSYDERTQYVALVQQCRLNESASQMKAIQRGIGSIVPLSLLSLFTWQDLEMRVCGRTEINLEVLKRNTRYRGGVSATDNHVRYFWQVLEQFGQRERMLFLRFAWGRQRLPSETELKNEPMKIFPYPCDDPDNRLPHAETCFFNLKIPAYTSMTIMKDRLIYAITQTKTIDADLQEEGNDIIRGLRGGRRGGRSLPFGSGFATRGTSPFAAASTPGRGGFGFGGSSSGSLDPAVLFGFGRASPTQPRASGRGRGS